MSFENLDYILSKSERRVPNREILKRWKKGLMVETVEMGGISPAYEQCIQILTFEIMAAWNPETPVPDLTEGGQYPDEFLKFTDGVIFPLDKKIGYGFSGAQVSAARCLAYAYLKDGHYETVRKYPTDRKILVTRNFPSLPIEDEK